MGISPIGAIGTTPVIYNASRIVNPQRANIVDSLNKASQEIQEKNQPSRRRYDNVDFSSNDAPPDFKAIDLIKKSRIEIRKAPEDTDKAPKIENPNRNTQTQQSKTIENNNEVPITEEKTPTEKTSEDVAKESSNSKVSPAQQKGIEAYQRIQSYGNALNISIAGLAG